jgi:hypothetical protein
MGAAPTQSRAQLLTAGSQTKTHIESALHASEQLSPPSHVTSHSLPSAHVAVHINPSHVWSHFDPIQSKLQLNESVPQSASQSAPFEQARSQP